jgi:hypothetical protein
MKAGMKTQGPDPGIGALRLDAASLERNRASSGVRNHARRVVTIT